MRYVKIEQEAKLSQIKNFATTFNVSETLISILLSRNIDTLAKIKQFLNANEYDLHNPYKLNNMEEAITRIKKAQSENETIVVFGDYDVDGISATYILQKYFLNLNMKSFCFLPHRIADGYGLTDTAILEVKNKFNPSLIVTVDCGISCHNEVEYAKSLGIDIIITDHHDIPEKLPDCITINPKLPNQQYPFQKLCGAGVAFKLVQAMTSINYAKQFLSVVAIATVADIVPLVDENRTMVQLGFKTMKRNLPLGLKKLAELCQIEKLNSQSISFKLAPKINAPGRLGDSTLVLDLYLEQDEEKATKLAEEIMQINSIRQDVGQKIYEECKQQIKDINIARTKAIILKSDNWEAGLLGIACAKLCGEYNRPVILFANVDGVLKGSGRSIHGINIMEGFKHSSNFIMNFGGHELAGGLTVALKEFDAFKTAFEEFCSKESLESYFEKFMEYNEEIDIKNMNLKFVEELELLEPCGCENKSPIFKLKFNENKIIQSKKDNEHLQLEIDNKKFISFGGIKFKPRCLSGGEKEALVEIQKSEYNGNTSVKGFIKFITSRVGFEQDIYDGYLENAILINTNKIAQFKFIKTLPKPLFGCVYVTFSKTTANYYARHLGLKIEEFFAPESTGESIILLAPQNVGELKNFAKVIILDGALNNFISEINGLTNIEVNVLESAKIRLPEITTDRFVFENCYKAIKSTINFNAYNLLELYVIKKESFANISFAQLVFCIKVFAELGFININKTSTKFIIKNNKGVKKQLTDSSLYNKVFKNDKL